MVPTHLEKPGMSGNLKVSGMSGNFEICQGINLYGNIIIIICQGRFYVGAGGAAA